MYLILSGKRRSGTPRVQLKVNSIKEASEATLDWIKKTGIYRSEVSSSHVFVSGMTVAKVGYDGTVYRVDPFTKEVYGVDKPDRVLYSPEAYKQLLTEETAKRVERDMLRHSLKVAKHLCVGHLFTEVYKTIKDNPSLTHKDQHEESAQRFAKPFEKEDGSPPDCFTFTFTCKTKSSYDARVEIEIGFNAYDNKLKGNFSPSLRGVDYIARECIDVIDAQAELIVTARNALAQFKLVLETERTKALLETLNIARAALGI
jgi:hypothetical protein